MTVDSGGMIQTKDGKVCVTFTVGAVKCDASEEDTKQYINYTSWSCAQPSKFSLLDSFFSASAPETCVFILPNHWMFVRLLSNTLQSCSVFTDNNTDSRINSIEK